MPKSMFCMSLSLNEVVWQLIQRLWGNSLLCSNPSNTELYTCVIYIYHCIKIRASLEVSLLSRFCEFQFQWATTAANIHMPQGWGRWGWWGSDTSNCSWKGGSWKNCPTPIQLQLIWINLRNLVHVVCSFREGNGRPRMVWPRMTNF